MTVKVVLKKRMVRNFVLTFSVFVGIFSLFFFYGFFPQLGSEYFYVEFLVFALLVSAWLLIWLCVIREMIQSLRVEVHESGITFLPINRPSIFGKQKFLPINEALPSEPRIFFWNDEIKVSVFLPFSKIRIAQKKRILGFLNFPYYALIPTRDWIENIDEIDAFLGTLPSNWLSELWREPGASMRR